MKKIALLLIATVFVIGIQSCSKEEMSIEEEMLAKDTLPINNKNFFNPVLIPIGDNNDITDLPQSRKQSIQISFPDDINRTTRELFRSIVKEQYLPSLEIEFRIDCYNQLQEVWKANGADMRSVGIYPGKPDLTKLATFKEENEENEENETRFNMVKNPLIHESMIKIGDLTLVYFFDEIKYCD